MFSLENVQRLLALVRSSDMWHATLFPGASLRNRLFMVSKMENTFFFLAVWSNWTFCNGWRKTCLFWDSLAEKKKYAWVRANSIVFTPEKNLDGVILPNVNCFLWSAKLTLVFIVINSSSQPAFTVRIVLRSWSLIISKGVCEVTSETFQQACFYS